MPLSQYFRLIDIMARMALRADATRFFLGYIWWVLEPLLWVARVLRGVRDDPGYAPSRISWCF